jgi:hypothetical protein
MVSGGWPGARVVTWTSTACWPVWLTAAATSTGPSSFTSRRWRSACSADWTAGNAVAVPHEPAVRCWGATRVSPIPTLTSARAIPRSPATRNPMADRMPWPISWPSTSTVTWPPVLADRCAMAGAIKAGYAPTATPQPVSDPSPDRIEPGSGFRAAQPNRSAPRRRHSARWRDEKGWPVTGSVLVSLLSRSATGSWPVA